MIMAVYWYDQTDRALQLAGKGTRTRQCYLRAVRMLSEFHNKAPGKITEQELQDYFLFRQNTSQWAPSTMGIAYYGIRFFYQNVARRDWPTLELIKVKREQKLPDILSIQEVRDALAHVTTFHNFSFLATVYACGLRLTEGLNLQVSDIDSQRLMIHVHRGKGAKDRYVPLPKATLSLLRAYWATHKNPVLLFPALGRSGKEGATSERPMSTSSVQAAFRKARFAAGIVKRRVTVHTLRHSYATHLLEAGVNIRVIQRNMGHANLETTMTYLHFTQTGLENAYELINAVMGGLSYGDN